MLNFWLKKPSGGGPAPLLKNPVKRLLRILIYLHISLLALSAFTAGFPLAHDLSCSPLTPSLINALVSTVISTIMTLYYVVIGNKHWGTEAEWGVVILVTCSLAVIDLAASAWATYVLSVSSVKIYQAYMDPVTYKIEPECFYAKAAIFYSFSFATIIFHTLVSMSCLAVSIILLTRASKCLQEICSLV